ncbi:UV DNA damage endonuclease [Chitinispirillum alkaliphilum]|nr:UV DNA damage endonuclease [Chitinispirillum alkaliphilum]
MKIGYPCLNNSVGCSSSSTFRLASYSEERLKTTVQNNLDCLEKILHFNIKENLKFFRIGSGIVPFASHSCCNFDWRSSFEKQLENIGDLIKFGGMRISMHPDQFVVLNSTKKNVVDSSIAEIEYHCAFIDSLNLPPDAKIQIHLGGVYGDKPAALIRFIDVVNSLSKHVRKRLVVENDDRLFDINDCLFVNRETALPVLFDSFHHLCNGGGVTMENALVGAASTWGKEDGIPMIDYSSQLPGGRCGSHIRSIDLNDFASFMGVVEKCKLDPDIMLEIKDKEASALIAQKWLKENRFL